MARRSTAHSPGSRRSSGCIGSSTRRIAWRARRTCSRVRPTARPCSRTHRSPPEPTRCARSTWQQACRRSPTRACTTTRTTSTTSTRADGTRLYTHDDPGVQVLDPGVALTDGRHAEGCVDARAPPRASLADFPFPAAGKTGTQQDNTNSWFVGATPQLTTAVWVGDPDAYTPMQTFRSSSASARCRAPRIRRGSGAR